MNSLHRESDKGAKNICEKHRELLTEIYKEIRANAQEEEKQEENNKE